MVDIFSPVSNACLGSGIFFPREHESSLELKILFKITLSYHVNDLLCLVLLLGKEPFGFCSPS